MTATSLPRLVRSLSRKYGPRTALIEHARGERVEYSWCDMWTGAALVGHDLVRSGLPEEAIVVIAAPTTASAVAAEIGVMAARCVACPLDPSLDDTTLADLLAQAAPRIVFTSEDPRARIERSITGLPAPVPVLPLPDVRPGNTSQPELNADLEARLERTGPGGHAVSLSACAQGPLVDFLHQTLTGTASALAEALGAVEGDTWYSPGPLVTPWDRVAGLYAPLVSGGEVVLPRPGVFQDPLQPFWVFRPTIAVIPPPHLAAVASRAREEARAIRGFAGWLARVALRWEGVLDLGVPPLPRRPWWREAARVGQARLKEILGGRLRFVLTQAGPLEPDAQRLLRAMGAGVCGSFGPPEAAGLLAVEHPGEETPPGSVGRLLDGLQIQVVKDGEMLVSGHAVMLSHRKVPRDQDPMLRDGWLRMGLHGRVDEHGWVYPDPSAPASR